MGQQARPERCHDCGGSFARTGIDGVGPLCDRCADRRLAAATGWPVLPDPPAPETFVGPDSRAYRMRYHFWRCPTGVVAEAEEMAGEEDIKLDGYHFKVLGDHDTDLRQLLANLRKLTADGIARAQLADTSGRLLMAGDELEGRLVWDDDGDTGKPYAVVVDGRRLSWEDFGRALEPFEGWRFRIAMLDIEQMAPAPADTPWWQDLDWTHDDLEGGVERP